MRNISQTVRIQAGSGIGWFKFYHFVNQEIRLPKTLCFEKHHHFLQLHVMNSFVRGCVTRINFFFEGISLLFSSKIIKITQHI